jgi:signal transduction histidine kinase
VSLPILMLTVRGAKEDFREGLSAGANDYLAKPYDDAELLARVRTLVRTKQLADEIREEARKTEASARLRSDFEEKLIGIASHDLRNPLNAILLGATNLLRREELDERSLKPLLRIQRSAQRAARLVEDLLDFTQARLGSGIPMHVKEINLGEVAAQVVEEVKSAHPDTELRLERSGPTLGRWDPDRLAQVLVNLLANAIKYGAPERGVTVRLIGEASEVRLEVHNHGAPISAETLPVLFEPMRRGYAESMDRSIGLGLYIVKHIVDAHSGTVEVDSCADRGTTFVVRLPTAPAR